MKRRIYLFCREKQEAVICRLRQKKHRILLSAGAGMLAAALCAGNSIEEPARPVQAWWGVMYPGFCFARPVSDGGEEDQKDGENNRDIKISFWLAKALDW